MTFGEKLKKARIEAMLSQEQLAEKLNVSRSAIAKWETNKGMPDIDNLKGIASLLDISIDYLLQENENVSLQETKEHIQLQDYEIVGKCRDQRDAVCVAKHGNADAIYALKRTKKMNKIECLIDFVVQPGVVQVLDAFGKNSYYLVENKTKQYLVKISDHLISTKELYDKVEDRFFMDGYQYKKYYQIL